MNYFEHIEAYDEGSLDPITRMAFESALDKNAELKLALENYQAAKRISEGFLEIDILEKLAELEAESKDEEHDKLVSKDKTNTKLIPLMFAAALIGGFCFLIWWVMNNTNERKIQEQYFAENYSPPIDPDAIKSIDTLEMDLFQKGKYYFALNEFEKSEDVLLQLLESATNQDTISLANYWLGHVYVNIGKYEEANALLQRSTEEEASSLQSFIEKMTSE